ncbi:putative DNA polymerase zeta catalytic subunit [Trypanosoma cruzi]|uniref:Putative DNA polymerase zeta catalytic subunit n=1 Tax=Trypanosoma cruzi TaxID=5693 RepID=A0A2V2VMD3_TRYCR|nr:putative DNA polymerase zeta catalytic subunit [Trypanosoma cruzi]
MNLHVVSVEHFLTKPDPLLGDELMSPLFHRVSDQCPVLHLFGYVCTSNEGSGPQDDINATVAAGGASNSIQQRSVCAHIHGVYPYFMVLRHDSRVSVMQFGAQLEAVALRVLRPSFHQRQHRPVSCFIMSSWCGDCLFMATMRGSGRSSG